MTIMFLFIDHFFFHLVQTLHQQILAHFYVIRVALCIHFHLLIVAHLSIILSKGYKPKSYTLHYLSFLFFSFVYNILYLRIASCMSCAFASANILKNNNINNVAIFPGKFIVKWCEGIYYNLEENAFHHSQSLWSLPLQDSKIWLLLLLLSPSNEMDRCRPCKHDSIFTSKFFSFSPTSYRSEKQKKQKQKQKQETKACKYSVLWKL